MSAAETLPKIKLPRLRKVTLRHLSIFSAKRVVTAELGDGVFCLAGANGLGKSTFLAAINFGLTGIVSDPTRTFESVDEHYKFSQPFSEDFFTGRVDESDRDSAEIILEFSVGDFDYKLRRSLFEATALEDLSIVSKKNGKSTRLVDADLESTQKHEAYCKHLVEHTGLAAFEQFVFLQHFVLTFDERRQLLFWEPKVLDQALFLAFGVDHNDSSLADTLRRDIEKQDSLARNYNWQATDARKKVEEIEAMLQATGDNAAIDLVAKHKALQAEVDAAGTQVSEWETQLRDSNLKVAEFGARQVALRNEYNEQFSARYRTAAQAQHPIIRTSILEERCEICGAKGAAVVRSIEQRSKQSECCLCGTARQVGAAVPDNLADLQKLDKEIAEARRKHDDFATKAQRATTKLDGARGSLAKAQEALEAFESENSNVVSHHNANTPEGVQAALASHRLRYQDNLDRKAKALAKRNEKKKERKKLMDAVEKRYEQAESTFLPLFTDLAQRFLGIDLGLSFERQSSGLKLRLDVKNTPRRHHHQLSESQRFFVDIALRMALAQFMADRDIKSTLYIDTPEGSLDIAYERRAGVMLAHFVASGNRLVMTANINSSGLLKSLAKECGRSKMILSRMTSWADLSEVQANEEVEFNKAYAEIEKAMGPAK
jgi:hypothetical protein